MKNENFTLVKTQMVVGKWVIFSLVFILFFITGSVLSQVTQQWVSRYNGAGNGDDEAYSIAVDGSGNVYVTGYCTETGTYHDYCTIKYNSTGGQQWVAKYNGPGNANDEAYSIALDGSGNVYVTGVSVGSATSFDYCTIKYNSAGVQQWVARYNGAGNSVDEAYSIAIDGSGNVYVTGKSWGGYGISYDYCTIKYNSSGSLQWVARYNGPGDSTDVAWSIALDGSGNVYVTGSSYGSGTSFDYCTIKYNSSGIQQWVARYNGPGNNYDYAYSLAVDGSGYVYVTGGSYGNGTWNDYCTIKYNSSGVQQWVARYNGPGNYDDVAYSIVLDGSGNVYVTGYSKGSVSYDYCTIKYNSVGDTIWVRRYNGPGNGNDYAYSIAKDGSGSVYVTGRSYGIGTDDDYCTVKYNSSGFQQWVARYDGPGNSIDYAYSNAVDGSGNVYVTGYSTGSGTVHDYCTIKYSQGVGIKKISTEVPSSFSLKQNYPNPFNPNTKISFDLPKNVNVKLTIYNMLGREVETIVNEQLNAGSYEVTFDGTKYTSGVYYYRLNAGEFVETKKMILVK